MNIHRRHAGKEVSRSSPDATPFPPFSLRVNAPSGNRLMRLKHGSFKVTPVPLIHRPFPKEIRFGGDSTWHAIGVFLQKVYYGFIRPYVKKLV